MLHADMDLPPDIQEGRRVDPAPIVRKIDFSDLSFSSAFRHDADFQKRQARFQIANTLTACERLGFLSGNSYDTYNADILAYARPEEKAVLLHYATKGVIDRDRHVAALEVLKSISFGHGLNDAEKFYFFRALQNEDSSNTARSLGLITTKQEARDFAESYVRASLHQIAGSLADEKLKAHFMSASLSDRELVDVVRHVDSKKRLEFIRDLHKAASNNESVQEFISGKLDNVLFLTSPTEKVTLMKELLKEGDRERNRRLMSSILHSCRTLEILNEVVDASSAPDLRRLGDRSLNEYLAHAVLGKQMRELPFPAELPKDATAEDVTRSIKRTRDCLEEAIRICESDKSLSRTQLARDYTKAAREALANLAYEARTYADNADELRLQANIYAEIGRIEMKYAINIGYVEEDFLRMDASGARKSKRWTMEDIRDIRAALEMIPENHLLFSPLVHEIQRVDKLGTGVLGARFDNGLIRIADVAVNHEGVRKAYDGISSLRVVLLHEIGHGLQIGEGASWVTFSSDGRARIGLGEAAYDFQDFMKLAGWRAFDRDRYKEAATPNRLILDGVEVPIGEVFEHKGEKLFLKYHRLMNVLIGYNADARFSHRDYSHASPWEDFAEAYTEYSFLPKRLIADAPEKFLYMELEFRRYHDNSEIMDLLRDALKNRAAGAAFDDGRSARTPGHTHHGDWEY